MKIRCVFFPGCTRGYSNSSPSGFCESSKILIPNRLKINPLHLLLLAQTLAAQVPNFQPRPAKELGEVRFGQAFQDTRGWLWFGAEEGLYRYDGTVFQPFAAPDSLGRQAVTALGERGDSLWVGYRNGRIGTVPKGGDFRAPDFPAENARGKDVSDILAWSPEEGTPRKTITGFAQDPSGGWWFSTYGEGLYCLKDKHLYNFNRRDDGLSGDEIYALTTDHRGRIWAATDNGVSICQMTAQGKKSVQHLGRAEGLPDEIVPALLADAAGNIWLGTDQRGVCHYSIDNQAFIFKTEDWKFGAVTALAVFEEVELWVGTASEGLVRLDLKTGVSAPLPDGHALRHARIRSLRKDREGLLWVVTDRGQVFSANVRFQLLAHPFSGAQAVLLDCQNRLWAGTKEGLFLRESGGSAFRQMLPGKQNVIALSENPNGQIWVGTFGNGVFILDKNGRLLRHLTERDGLANGNVLSIAFSGKSVWLATLGGVNELEQNGSDVAHFQRFTYQSGLGTSYVYKVFVDHRNQVWFATDGKGLAMLDGENFKHYTDAGGHVLKTIYCITEDRDGRLWFSSDVDGLFCREPSGLFRHFDRSTGLHSQKITGLETDANGQLIIAYEEGLDILTPATGHVAFFDENAGAPHVENNLNALCHEPNGHVWLGSQQGILRVASFPETFAIDPQTRLRSVSLFQKPIDYQLLNSFAHDQNYFIFDFTGLWYADPDAVKYRFKLDGFDPVWKTAKDHFASYPNLAPGRYTFRVQSTEHGRFEGTPEAAFAFLIRQPIWARWWFLVLAAGGTVAAVFWFFRERIGRIQRLEQLKKAAVESQFSALKSQINPHFLFNSFNTLIALIEENPGLAVRYVEHLSDFYRRMMVYRERDLISLEEEMVLVKDFSFLLKKRFEDNFNLVARVDGQAGSIMPLTLQILVENAVKHNIISKAKPLTVEIFTEGGDFVVVRNNLQRKIQPDASTNFGLASLTNRYRLLGERAVEVAEEGGFFTVRVPLLKN